MKIMDLDNSESSNKCLKVLLQISNLKNSCFILTPFLLSLNITGSFNKLEFLKVCLDKGCRYVKQLILNIIYFLLRDEEYEIVQEHFLDSMIKTYVTSSHKNIKRLVIFNDKIKENILLLISESNFEMKVFILFNNYYKNMEVISPTILLAFLRKPSTAKQLYELGYIEKLFIQSGFDLNRNIIPNLPKKQSLSQLDFNSDYDFDDEDFSKQFYLYKQSEFINEICFSDSSQYLSSILKFPWQLNILVGDKDQGLITHVSFDPINWAIRLESGNIHQILSED